MAQHDYNIANATFPNTRTDINNALSAIATNNSGDGEPSTTFANQWWYETDTNKLYIRNEDNDAFIHILTLNQTNDTVASLEGASTLAGIDDQSSSNDDQITITDTAVVINDDSDDLDFRVETNGNANMLFISGANNVVGVGSEGDLGVGLHIKSGDSGLSSLGDNDADELVIEGSGNSGMSILSGTGNAGRIYFGDSGDVNIGFIHYAHDDNAFLIGTNTSLKFTIGSSETVVNDGSLDHDFRVESNSHTHMLFVDGGNNRVGVKLEPDLGDGLHIKTADSGGSIDAWADELVLEGSGDSGMTILSGNGSDGSINWGDDGDNDAGRIVFSHTTNSLGFYTSGAEKMRIYTNGMVQFSPGTNSRFYKIDPDVDSFYPTVNDVSDIGYTNLKWDDIRATNGTIVTSDRNEKDNITESDLGLDFVNKLKPVSYRLKEKTRTHYGLISQDIEDLLGEFSKTGTDFAGFIKSQKEDHSVWTKEDSETQGDNPTAKVGEFKFPVGTAKLDGEYTYGLRYEEFISPIIKAIQELAVKVKALEDA